MCEKQFEYDVGLSFAGEQRHYVQEVAHTLKSLGVRVFFDDFEREKLWGKNLTEHLSDVYQNKCYVCVIFVSQDYINKAWPTVEKRSAMARAMKERKEYILPARFDDTAIPDLLDTVAYIDLRETSPLQLSDLIAKNWERNQDEITYPQH